MRRFDLAEDTSRSARRVSWSAGVSPAASGRLARSRSWSPGGTPDDCGLEVRAPSDMRRLDLAEDVGGHRIVLVALGEERFVERGRLAPRDRAVRPVANAAPGGGGRPR